MKQLLIKLKKDPVLAASLVLAVASAFWVKPTAAYIGYIDWREYWWEYAFLRQCC